MGFFLEFFEFPNGPVLFKLFYALFLKEILLRLLHAGFHRLSTAIFIIFPDSVCQRLSVLVYQARHIHSARQRGFLARKFANGLHGRFIPNIMNTLELLERIDIAPFQIFPFLILSFVALKILNIFRVQIRIEQILLCRL